MYCVWFNVSIRIFRRNSQMIKSGHRCYSKHKSIAFFLRPRTVQVYWFSNCDTWRFFEAKVALAWSYTMFEYFLLLRSNFVLSPPTAVRSQANTKKWTYARIEFALWVKCAITINAMCKTEIYAQNSDAIKINACASFMMPFILNAKYRTCNRFAI